MPRKENPLDKRVCVKHAGVKTLRIYCDTDGCMCFVRVPIKSGERGGTNVREWVGCMYVLNELRKYAESSGLSLDVLLDMNR